MRTYFLRRILAMIPMFFLMTGVYFTVQNYLPGGPVQEILQRIRGSDEGGKGQALSQEDVTKLRMELEKQYGLDQPIPVRYWTWLTHVVRFDFGDSTATRRPAIETIVERIPISLGFGIPGFFLTYLVCIFLGVWKALRDGTAADHGTSIALFVAYSIPAVVVSVILLLVFCTDRVLPGGALFPLGGARSENYDSLGLWAKWFDYGKHMFLPVCASMLGGFTTLTLLTKGSMLDVLHSDFVRTARAKGLGERQVIFKHALRNAVLPLMVGIGGFLGAFVAGSIIIESVFNLPGMGLLLIEALNSRDYNVLMGVAVIQSLIIMFGQFLSDVAYMLVDPRIDFR